MAMAMAAGQAMAQGSGKLFFTTGAGTLKMRHSLGDVLKPALSFNSGLEATNKKNGFLQATADVNTLRYDQKIRDDNSSYLFQNTNSSLLMLGLNGGKNLWLNRRSFFSVYAGGGYLNIGEPRVTVQSPVIRQDVNRKRNVFGRAGSRFAYISPIPFLQFIYLDANWWTSPARVQGSALNGFSLFIGSRMSL